MYIVCIHGYSPGSFPTFAESGSLFSAGSSVLVAGMAEAFGAALLV